MSAAASERSDRRRLRRHACRFCRKDYAHRQSLFRHMRMEHSLQLLAEELREERLAEERYIASHRAHLQRLANEVSSNNSMHVGAVNSAEAFSFDRRLAPLNQGRQPYHPTSYNMQLQIQRQHNAMSWQNASTAPPELTSVHSRSLQQLNLGWNSGNVPQTAQNLESALSLDRRVALANQGRQAIRPIFDVGTPQQPLLYQVQGHDDMTLSIPPNSAMQPLTYPYGSNVHGDRGSNTLQYSWQDQVSTLHARPVDVTENLFLPNRPWVPPSASSHSNEPVTLIQNPLAARFRSALD